MTECDCAVCRAYQDERSAAGTFLHAWADEAPPASLRARVLARAIAAPQQAPPQARAPVSAPDALPLFAVVAVMAALVAAIRLIALWGPAWRYWPRLAGLTMLEALGPTGIATLLLLGTGALVTLALAPALFLESQGLLRRRRRTLGLHG
jgi:hypothetical protein